MDLFVYFLLPWVFIAARELSLVAASRSYSSLRSTGSRVAGSVVVAYRPSYTMARGLFPDQRSNPLPSALTGRSASTVPPGKSLVFENYY